VPRIHGFIIGLYLADRLRYVSRGIMYTLSVTFGPLAFAQETTATKPRNNSSLMVLWFCL